MGSLRSAVRLLSGGPPDELPRDARRTRVLDRPRMQGPDLADVRGQGTGRAGSDDRGRRIAQPAAEWGSGDGQDDARTAAAVDPSPARPRGSDRGDPHSQPAGRGGERARAHPPVPSSPPHRDRGRAARRCPPGSTRGGGARSQRRSLPGRALGVLPLGPGVAAPAARGRSGHDRPGTPPRRLPRTLHARGRHQPVPVRVRRRARALPLQRSRPRPPPAQAERTPARPRRSAGEPASRSLAVPAVPAVPAAATAPGERSLRPGLATPSRRRGSASGAGCAGTA